MKRLFGLVFLFLCLAACNLPAGQTTLPAASPSLAKAATLSPSSSPTPAPALPSPTAPTDSGWQLLLEGMEVRQLRVEVPGQQSLENVLVLRFDPALFTLRMAYDPAGKSLREWLTPEALAVVNGGFYRLEESAMIPTGMTVIAGEVIGSSYEGFAGMLSVRENQIDLRWLAEQPLSAGEIFDYALQSFPILVKNPGELGFPAENEDNLPARRSAVARDLNGRMLFIVASSGWFTLHQFSAWLTGSDLQLDLAVNLDGGPSSGMLIRQANGQGELLAGSVEPLVPLPLAVQVVARE